MSITKTVVNRYLEKIAILSEDGIHALLLKLRKGVGRYTWKQLQTVLSYLDPRWEVKPCVGLVPLYEENRSYNKTFGFPQTEGNDFFIDHDREKVEAKHKEITSSAVGNLPANPQHGKLYYLDVSPIQKHPHLSEDIWVFTFKPWMGHNGIEVTSPTGKTFKALPRTYELIGRKQSGSSDQGEYRTIKIPDTGDTIIWLNKETDWLDQINQKLNLETFVPGQIRTRESTGSCPVCFQNIKARPYIVLHGYKRPGTGGTIGNCYGTGFLPFEVSVNGTEKYLEKVLRPSLQKAQERLSALKAGELTEIYARGKKITPDHPNWKNVFEHETHSLADNIKWTKGSIDTYTKLVQNWKPRPLPQEGAPHINWYVEGQKGHI